jgi:hypothetical protein
MERQVCQFQTVSTKGFTPEARAIPVPFALRYIENAVKHAICCALKY